MEYCHYKPTMNRILRSERCRLLPENVDSLMKLSIEGPQIPDVRDGTSDDHKKLDKLIDSAVAIWQREAHRD